MSSPISPKAEKRWKMIKNLFKRSDRLSIIVDGPNLLRKSRKGQVKLEDVIEASSELGSITEKIVILNTFASKKLIQAIVNSGFQPVVASGELYLKLAILSLDLVYRNPGDIILIASRDARCTPIIMKLKEKGVKTAILGFEPGFSIALKNNADFALELFAE